MPNFPKISALPGALSYGKTKEEAARNVEAWPCASWRIA
jgi:hypothetical protein